MDLLSVFVASCATSCRAIFCGVMLLSALSADALPLFPGGNHAGEDHSNESHAGEFLDQIILSGGNLSGSDFSSASMRSADLTNANLSGANFAGAVMAEAIFAGATITSDTLFAGTDLSDVVLSGLDLRGTTIDQAYDLSAALFINSNLSGLDLSGLHLHGAVLDGAQLIGTNLTDVLFLGRAVGANFSNATLVRTVVNEESLVDAIFRNADLRYASFEAELENNDFSGADLRYSHIDLEAGSFRNANFANADLRFATFLVVDSVPGVYDGTNWAGAKICGTVFLQGTPDTTGAIGCSVPEPTSLSLMALGIGGVAAWSMRRRVQSGKMGSTPGHQ
jgi:uncharacterized protein YjbI with pentapeptide repeats